MARSNYFHEIINSIKSRY